MTKRRVIPLVLLLAVLVPAVPATPREKAAKPYEDKASTIEVVRFSIQPGVEFPPDYLVSLMEELVDQLKKTDKFLEVLREGEKPTVPAAEDSRRLKLMGIVTAFQPGSRAKRNLIGFGAGKTRIAAHVLWFDAGSGELLWQADVEGRVVAGLTGGESIGATRDLAKKIAKETKKKLF